MENKDFINRAPELLSDLAKHTEVTVKKILDTDEDAAIRVGQAVAIAISEAWAGQNIYIPRAVSLLAHERDRQIWNEFNGHNHAALAKKFGVSMQWIYRIIDRVQKEEIARRQIDMFSNDGY